MAKKKQWVVREELLVLLAAAVVTFGLFVYKTRVTSASEFDDFGYNYKARLFQGLADGVDKSIDGKVWGDPTYGRDRLVMKWSKAWDDARFKGKSWTCDAWEDNEWNGKAQGGSGEVWHYKIVWVGPQLQNSPCWRAGGQPIWGEFEVIFSQGTVANEHFWDAHAERAGYGMF